MDLGPLVDSMEWIGAAIGAGVLGNRADVTLLALKRWFTQRGAEPEGGWAEPVECVPSYAHLVARVSEHDIAELRSLLASAKSRHPNVTVNGLQQNATTGDNSRVVQIGRVDGDVTFG